jgi:hypothetical protein
MDGATPRDGSIEDRLAAVERAITEDQGERAELPTETADRVDAVEDDLGDLTDRVAELEAATQALRGYVGNVRAVNEEVQQRADAALAKAEAAQSALEERDHTGAPDTHRGPTAYADEPTVDAPGTRRRAGSSRDSHPAGPDPDRPPADRGDREQERSLLARIRALL